MVPPTWCIHYWSDLAESSHGCLLINGKRKIDTDSILDFDSHLMFQPLSICDLPYFCSFYGYECTRCHKEYLDARREFEKSQIREMEDLQEPQNCAIDMKWAIKWRDFVHNRTDKIPGLIDNRGIATYDGSVKGDLIKDVDFLMLPKAIWDFLMEVYGGGPRIQP